MMRHVCIIMAFTFFDCKNAIKMKSMRDTCHLLTIPRSIEIQCLKWVSKSNPQEGPKANSKRTNNKSLLFFNFIFISFLSRVTVVERTFYKFVIIK